MTNSRDAILQRIRAELSQQASVAASESIEVWPHEKPTSEVKAERFSKELTAVGGEVIRCGTAEEAAQQLAQLAVESRWRAVGAMDRSMIRQIASSMPSEILNWNTDDWQPDTMAAFSASLVEPEALLADTGSCLIACPTAQDRLLCYLPPFCVVLARVDQLAEHMPAAWASATLRLGALKAGGELVIVTGPSRTADIEKTLILGVHGPKRLIAILF